MWCPQDATVKVKMLYAASFDSLKNAVPSMKVVQAFEEDDICEEEIRKQFLAEART